ncbi:MAG: hypothetical protein PHQ22_10400 [Sulfuricurvum sp.]|jgi:hypothetical protein|nr:hypothetical protein [Sulfuricurvum sp.]
MADKLIPTVKPTGAKDGRPEGSELKTIKTANQTDGKLMHNAKADNDKIFG